MLHKKMGRRSVNLFLRIMILVPATFAVLGRSCRAFVPSKSPSRRDFARFHSSSSWISVERAIDLYQKSEKKDGDSTKIRFVDGTWFHKGDRNGREEYMQGPRIPNSVYFDPSDVACNKDLFPDLNPQGLYAMLPPESLFARTMDAFDIDNDTKVIVYGREGCHFLPRVWFTFQALGHDNVAILKGSLTDWQEAGGPVETTPASTLTAKDIMGQQGSTQPSYSVDLSKGLSRQVVGLQDMKDVFTTNDGTVIVDSRGSSFQRKGCMPNAFHVPYSSLANAGSTIGFKSPSDLKQVFVDAGIDPLTNDRIVCSCGSGVSACSLYLALLLCGREPDQTFLYDGSWNEWSQQDDDSAPKMKPK